MQTVFQAAQVHLQPRRKQSKRSVGHEYHRAVLLSEKHACEVLLFDQFRGCHVRRLRASIMKDGCLILLLLEECDCALQCCDLATHSVLKASGMKQPESAS